MSLQTRLRDDGKTTAHYISVLLTILIIASFWLSPVYTIQPVVKPVVRPVVSYIQTCNRLSNPFDNRTDNRLYRVNGVLVIRITYLQWKTPTPKTDQ